MSRPRVVIVGAGVVGLSVAVELARSRRVDVTVLEQAHVASGSSGLSAGIYNRQYTEPQDVEIRVLAARILDSLEQEGRIRLVRNGFVRLARDEDALERFSRSVTLQAEFDAGTRARVLTPDELGTLIPELDRSGVLGALHGPDDGYLDGHQLCTTYYDEAVECGVDVRQRTELRGMSTRASGTHVLETSTGAVEADVVVNAAGSWAGPVGELLGVTVPLCPQRHEAFVFQFQRPLAYRMPSVMDYVVGAPEPGLYFRAEGDRQLLAGLHTNELDGTDSEDPDQYFRGVVSDHVDAVAGRLLAALPTLGDMGFHSGWAGLYPLSADNQPVLGPVPGAPGVVLACGLGGVGVNLGPAVGRLVAEWILHGEPRSGRAQAYAPDRFAGLGTEGRS